MVDGLKQKMYWVPRDEDKEVQEEVENHVFLQ